MAALAGYLATAGTAHIFPFRDNPPAKPAATKTRPPQTAQPATASDIGASGDQQSSSPTSATTTPTVAPSGTIGTVLDVLGEQLSDATSTLKADGFDNIPWVYECLGSTLIGDVILQNPVPGTTIAVTSPIQLTLQAKDCATVPNVVGLQLADAETALQKQGITDYSWQYGCYGSSRIDAVFSQSPSAGTSYGKSQLVSIKLQANNC